MKKAQEKLLDIVWKAKPKNFILKNKNELLILASIIQKETSHIDDSDGDKVAMFDFQSYPSESNFEIHLDSNCSPKHLSPETIDYLEAYKRTGQLINVVIVTSDKEANTTLSEEETEIMNRITDNIIYK